MGVPRSTLPQWDDIQILTAQLAMKSLREETEVGTELVVGPNAKKPLVRGKFIMAIPVLKAGWRMHEDSATVSNSQMQVDHFACRRKLSPLTNSFGR